VGDQNIVGGNLIALHGRCRVFVEKRINHDGMLSGMKEPTAVSQPGKRGCHFVPLSVGCGSIAGRIVDGGFASPYRFSQTM
jgi:hypothetical protein